MRRRKLPWFTVEYKDEQGRVKRVGHALTDVELIQLIIKDPVKFPNNGKIVKVN